MATYRVTTFQVILSDLQGLLPTERYLYTIFVQLIRFYPI